LHIIFHAFAWLSLARTGLRETLLALGKNDANGNRQASRSMPRQARVRAAAVHQIKPLLWNVLDEWLSHLMFVSFLGQTAAKGLGIEIHQGCHKPTFYWKY
jgi:hypothetical protein